MTTAAPAPAVHKSEALVRLNAGFVTARAKAPYLAMAITKLRRIEAPHVPTLEVDSYWRMYWNPSYILTLTVEQVASAILHELGHLLRDHSARFAATGDHPRHHGQWNIAGDLHINHDIEVMGMPLGEGWMRIDAFIEKGYEVTAKQTTEATYRALRKKDDEDQQQQQSQQGDGSSQDQDGQSDGQNSQQGDGSSQDQDGQSDGQNSQQGDGSASSAASSQGSGTGSCGSCSDGQRRDYELDPDNDESPGVTQGEADLTRRRVAKEVSEYARVHGRGSIPGGLEEWADELLNPTVDWRAVLKSFVQARIAARAGHYDWSYARVSRRENPDFVNPGRVAPEPPQVEVVIDTSGSVSLRELTQALSEVAAILKAVGYNRGVLVTVCDTVAYKPQEFTGDIRNITLAGRGGTDMRIGIDAAAERRPRNDIIITMTDGYTPWPTHKPERNTQAAYFAAIFEGNPTEKVPNWMRTVEIPRSLD